MTCGRVLSGKWKEFQKRIASGEEARKVLDDLNIKSYCCRTLFLTHKDIYKQIDRFERMQ
jgi:DNA-directed RNA polymerase subunit N